MQAKHVAIIMDGNGRWAQARKHSRAYGHVRGIKAVRRTIEKAVELKLSHLSLFTLSQENWQRPSGEVQVLIQLLRKFLRQELRFLMRHNIRLKCIGDLKQFPADVQQTLSEVMLTTSLNTGMLLCLALSYGSQQEITMAALRLAKAIARDPSLAENFGPEDFHSFLDTGNMPAPDLIIRTSGESRLSNFMLFQAAYSELYFTDKLWPDFCGEDLQRALEWFSQKERRFGKTSEQVRDLQSTSQQVLQ